MLFFPPLQPVLHGSVGALDEILLYTMPLVVAVIILIIASRRAREKECQHTSTRERTPEDGTPLP